jgi:hypothetical protein
MNQKQFDIELQKIIKNTIDITWDYIYNFNDLDGIYLYVLLGTIKSSDIVFVYKEVPYKKHKIFNIRPDFIVRDDKQDLFNTEIMLEIEKIEELFIKYKREMPYEIKIIYSPKTKNLDVKIGYENPFSDEDSAIGDGFRNWIKSLGITM